MEQTGWIQPWHADPHQIGDWYWNDEDGETRYFGYDENGQKKNFTDAMGRVTTFDYDLRNRLWRTNETVNSVPRTTETLYDTAGNKIDVIFPDLKTQKWRDYDAFGQAHKWIDERANVTNLDYWAWGPMKKLQHVGTHRQRDDGGVENQDTMFFPDRLGRPWQTVFPDGSIEQIDLHLGGQVALFKNRKGAWKILNQPGDYDARGCEKHHSWSAGTSEVSRVWDNANRMTQISNRFSTMTSPMTRLANCKPRRTMSQVRRSGRYQLLPLQHR